MHHTINQTWEKRCEDGEWGKKKFKKRVVANVGCFYKIGGGLSLPILY